jgi:hypothetical protein
MTEPEPGKPFEWHGLTWEPQDSTTPLWFANVGEYQLNLRHDSRGRWAVLSGNFSFDSAEDALAWAVRVCLSARCGACSHHYKVGERLFCSARNSFENEDGFCHLWWGSK